MDNEDEELLRLLAESNLSPTTIDLIMRNKSGVSLTPQQIAAVKRHTDSIRISNADGTIPTTSAEKLLNWLTKDLKMSFVAVFGESDSLLSAKVRAVHRSNIQCSTSSPTAENLPLDLSVADSAEADTEIKLYMKASGASRIKVLLGCAWVSDQNVENFVKFPEVLSGDTTHKTNSSKMPLHLYTGLNSEGKLFPVMHVFMPSKQQ
jgi:hypothetical protein